MRARRARPRARGARPRGLRITRTSDLFEVPGLGIAHFFYLPVAAFALTGGIRRVVLAGAVAGALFTLGVIINPNISPSELLTLSTPIRFVTFMSMGGLPARLVLLQGP